MLAGSGADPAGRVAYVKTVQHPGMLEPPPSSSTHAETTTTTTTGVGPGATTTARYAETTTGPVAVKRMIISADINSSPQVLLSVRLSFSLCLSLSFYCLSFSPSTTTTTTTALKLLDL